MDLRYAVRNFLASPGLAAVAILSLALGIGANTAIFSLIDQMLLRPLPVVDPDSLVIVKSPGPRMGRVSSDESDAPNAWSYPMYKELRDRNQVLSGVLARHQFPASLSLRGNTERGPGELVSGNYFTVLGVKPAIGRLFTADDDRLLGGHHVAVLSFGYWSRRFAADPSVLNQTIQVNGQPMTIVGVSARGFYGVQSGQAADVFVPMTMMGRMMPTWENPDGRRSHWMNLLGRLKPGITRAQAVASLQVTYKGLLEADANQDSFPREFREKYVARRIGLDPGSQGRTLLQEEVRRPLLLLLSLVGLVLLIACANVANLLLARGLSRARDTALRLALGASRARLIRQLLLESVLLSLTGGFLGVAVAYWTVNGLLAYLTDINTSQFHAAPDLRVLAFNFALAMFVGVAFGLLPALRSTRPDLAPILKDQAASASASAAQSRLRRFLIVGQVAFTALLLTCAGLFARSLMGLRGIALGVNTDSVVRFSVSPHLNGYDTNRTTTFHRRLHESLASLPGVSSAGFAEVPIFANSTSGAGFTIEGYTPAPNEDTHPSTNWISPGYFSTLGIPLRSGREILDSDGVDAPKVCVVNDAFARRFFQGKSPLGYKVAFGTGNRIKPDIEIVGVVADSKHSSVRSNTGPFVYLAFSQRTRVGEMTFYARASVEPEALMNSIRDRVRKLDPNIPVVDMKTLEAHVQDNIGNDRLMTALAVSFALLASLLAAIGIYGVMAYSVARRTREIGIRVALGALPTGIRKMVLKEVFAMALGGIAIGLPAALALGGLVESMLYGVKGRDATVATAAIVIVLAVAFAAGYFPARRATTIDPLKALRYE
jgi:predicted permease